MEIIEKLDLLLTESSPLVDLRPILPPSKQLAQIIAAFSNSSGGLIALGAKWKPKGGYEVSGLSMDFNANAITHKALDYLSPMPIIDYGYHTFHGHQIFLLNVPASQELVLLQGKKYIRVDKNTVDADEVNPTFRPGGDIKVMLVSEQLQQLSTSKTLAKSKVLAHYQSSLKIIDNLGALLYPENINTAPSLHEGKILIRILFSSIVDNFEIYLGDLLYEIWLSNPNTLKSGATVTVEQVLNCSDIEEFIIFYARDKISKMKKGSVKTFIKDNNLINELGVFTPVRITEVDAILQIRHLFSHSNGIVDDQFLRHYQGSLNIGDDYLLSTDDILEKLSYLAHTIDLVDQEAINAHSLSSL
jgi:hypothetical protein